MGWVYTTWLSHVDQILQWQWVRALTTTFSSKFHWNLFHFLTISSQYISHYFLRKDAFICHRTIHISSKMDGLELYSLFNGISIISGLWKGWTWRALCNEGLSRFWQNLASSGIWTGDLVIRSQERKPLGHRDASISCSSGVFKRSEKLAWFLSG